MTSDEEIVQRLYESLQRNDAAGAAECYCDDAVFRDIAFDLKGKPDIAAVWRFVCASRIKVSFRDIHQVGSEVKGHWKCDYKFHDINPVQNEIDSVFTLCDGRILSHQDHANRWRGRGRRSGSQETSWSPRCHSSYGRGRKRSWKRSEQTRGKPAEVVVSPPVLLLASA